MKISIIGVGLIGGSIALKLKKKGIAQRVLGIDQNKQHLQQAVELGIIDGTADLEEGIKNSDLVIVAIPVDAARKLLPNVLDLVSDQQTVMDAGSTKAGIVQSVHNHPKRARYVAFHPMWGTENSGPGSAVAESFAGKAGVICNKELSAPDALQKAETVISALEMHPVYMNAEDHDIHTAYISHISHITSYALANTVLEKEREEETIFQLASSGFSSTVRLAKSHPEMWVPIFKQNRDNVLDVLNEHISQLRKFKSALEKENYDYLEELISNANKIRGILDK
ncbi:MULTISPECIES: prephenate dehydrogenase [Chryseobacterium]|uniref:Prephenate dehydrogenase n=1 Tax=Chryseobacterium camelliae TaxID=1265445 RepID=A0ABU0TEB5_9FLAO|nr:MULTISPECIES: prephenate dehydrogenase [Chryseobacterium]MDT3406792.1 prephenate dehydrogenase [Pseudacidovorax intermedius]MDQ1095412.1 prephenate dehydrogenase [Chryseobacterium camelliae]MDQ1099352.1 prephenate dehydrogenase [Chryseobacterium sp. SORGH_AS_1048]MDR6086698.1 prephenate dehydrogenase [Chryseobacterium sp. SORGH_AS_0909]MDR6131070.1 prephenate dehydrogenase [Chryseobacterium sp. SORGH_AS_1175]